MVANPGLCDVLRLFLARPDPEQGRCPSQRQNEPEGRHDAASLGAITFLNLVRFAAVAFRGA